MKTNGNAETAGIEKPRQHNFLRLWGGLVQRTFPFMEEEVGELGPKARLFVTVCETVVKPWATSDGTPAPPHRFRSSRMCCLTGRSHALTLPQLVSFAKCPG